MFSGANNVAETVVEAKLPSECRKFTWSIAEFAVVKDSAEMIALTRTKFEMGHSIGYPVTLSVCLQQAGNNIGVYFQALEEQKRKSEDGWAWLFGTPPPPPVPRKVMVTAFIKVGTYTHAKFSFRNLAGGGWGWPQLIPQAVDLNKLPLDAEGNLLIEITLYLYNLTGSVPTVASLTTNYKSKFTHNFSRDMAKMYKEPGLFSTEVPTMITVFSKDGKKNPSNSMMLAARSPVFQSMFKTPMKEAKEGVVKLVDIEGDALKVFLNFMHTGELMENWKKPEILEQLTCAAHKYLMQDLLDFLDDAIPLVCTPENCVSMLRVAIRLGLKKVEAALLKKRQDQWKEAASSKELAKLIEK